MKILIVDDSKVIRFAITRFVEEMKHEVRCVEDGSEVMDALEKEDFDLILMDILMPKVDGITATKLVKSSEKFKDIPIIMVSGQTDESNLVEAFEAGAMDYITKPPSQIQLQVRVKSALKLKSEMDTRKMREMSLLEVSNALEEVNRKLEKLSTLDPLTGIPNRRYFDEYIAKEWNRHLREGKSMAVVMVDIDHFKKFNDTYGHQGGDTCIQKTALELQKNARRGGDLTARYGGEEFVVILSDIGIENATLLAERMRKGVEDLKLEHKASDTSSWVTVSIGVTSAIPSQGLSYKGLIEEADKCLYRSKEKGRNAVCSSTLRLIDGKECVDAHQ